MGESPWFSCSLVLMKMVKVYFQPNHDNQSKLCVHVLVMLSACIGLSVECQVDRSQIKNRQIAMQTLKARIYRQQLDAQAAATQATRKQQVLFMLVLPHFLIIYNNCSCPNTICCSVCLS